MIPKEILEYYDQQDILRYEITWYLNSNKKGNIVYIYRKDSHYCFKELYKVFYSDAYLFTGEINSWIHTNWNAYDYEKKGIMNNSSNYFINRIFDESLFVRFSSEDEEKIYF